ncbi:hypothetical protein Anapl_08817 [Anas platyrhynchos]|uniref:Uncharacterized protein n=1 Tax=Anas platyrhynchos TaxID=8839 RepID=R0LDU0_ANAPL|nr:hypothetical protein Anapl_08817 [Anas platyrhynchos]
MIYIRQFLEAWDPTYLVNVKLFELGIQHRHDQSCHVLSKKLISILPSYITEEGKTEQHIKKHIKCRTYTADPMQGIWMQASNAQLPRHTAQLCRQTCGAKQAKSPEVMCLDTTGAHLRASTSGQLMQSESGHKRDKLVPRQQDRQVTLEHIPALFTSHPTWPDPKAPGPATDAAGLGISLQPWALREGTQPVPRGGSARGKAKWSPRELQTSQPLFPLRPVLLPAIWSSHKQSQ